jgi:hypothetical protein
VSFASMRPNDVAIPVLVADERGMVVRRLLESAR